MSEEMTVTEALTKAREYLDHVNAGQADKVVLFYNITPYGPGTSGYIHYVLGSKYSARHQMMGALNVRTCWAGTPPGKHFMEDFLTELVKLRQRMVAEITFCRTNYEYLGELEAYRASDEVDKIDQIFFE